MDKTELFIQLIKVALMTITFWIFIDLYFKINEFLEMGKLFILGQ